MNLEQFVQQATPDTIRELAVYLASDKSGVVAKHLRTKGLPNMMVPPGKRYKPPASPFKSVDADIWPFAVDYIKATHLFTGGHVATVRNPEGFDYDMVEPWFDFVQGFGTLLGAFIEEDPERFDNPPNKEDYLKANFLIRQMANSEHKQFKAQNKLYRGLHSVPANVFLDLCKPGESYNIGTMASMSSFQSEAASFASEKTGNRYRIMYLVENPKGKGTPISALSAYPTEMEVVLGGDIKIERFSLGPILKNLSEEVQKKWSIHGNIADFSQLIEFV